ncbi:MAG: hypothetical protein AAF547_05605 [Actinomycetota bacterium]
MSTFVSLFPLLVVVAGLVLAVLAFRLDRRLSRGARSAGPREVVRPVPVGLQQTPWELQALHDQVQLPTGSAVRRELIHTVNKLTEAAGVTDPNYRLPPEASDAAIAGVILHLEQRLELPPVVDHATGAPVAPSHPHR